jgi:transposase
MLMMPGELPILVARDPVDMRKNFDGLCIIIQKFLQKDPMKATLYVFFNRQRDKIKILYWDRNGYAIWYKRLSKGRFRPPEISQSTYRMSLSDLTCLLEGIDLLNRQRLNSV